MAHSDDWDTVDPGDLLRPVLGLLRTYARALLMYKPASAPRATSWFLTRPRVSAPPTTAVNWTCRSARPRRRQGRGDGTEVSAAGRQVRGAALDRQGDVPERPGVLRGLPEPAGRLQGPVQSKGVNTDSAITTPDDYTVVFHLKQAFGGFDNMAALSQTAPTSRPRTPARSTAEHVISTGLHMFDVVETGKRYTLKRTRRDQATDLIRKALPDGYEIDAQGRAERPGQPADLGVTWTWTSRASVLRRPRRGKVLSDLELKKRADNPTIPRLQYMSIS